MISRDDLSDLHEIMPDKSGVTYYARAVGIVESDDRFAPAQRIENCERRPISQEERQFVGGATFEVEPEVWHIWASEAGRIRPKAGDKFKDDEGGWWQVMSVPGLELLRTRYRLICVAMGPQ